MFQLIKHDSKDFYYVAKGRKASSSKEQKKASVIRNISVGKTEDEKTGSLCSAILSLQRQYVSWRRVKPSTHRLHTGQDKFINSVLTVLSRTADIELLISCVSPRQIEGLLEQMTLVDFTGCCKTHDFLRQ